MGSCIHLFHKEQPAAELFQLLPQRTYHGCGVFKCNNSLMSKLVLFILKSFWQASDFLDEETFSR